MPVGEVIALLCKHASSLDRDHILMMKDIDSIEVNDEYIKLYFTDFNTRNYYLYQDGTVKYEL